MIEVKQVITKKEQKQFLDFPLKMYKNNEYFVPPLYSDEKKIFSKNYFYYETCEAIFYNAYKDGLMVGRIMGILQNAYNEKNNEKRVRFTRFDSINDVEVAKALFLAIEKWAKEKGMDTVCGPLGFSDLEREGLLIEGFDQLSTFEEQYNHPYYQELIENLGYEKEVDWVERRLYAPKEVDTRLHQLSELMLKKHNLHMSNSKNTKEFLKDYADQFFEVLDLTYTDIYGTVPFTSGMKKSMIAGFKMIVDVRHVAVVLDENNKVVCFGICFPAIGKALQKTSGHLTPLCLIKLLRAIKKPKSIDLGLVGVLPEYERKGISSIMISKIMKMLESGIEYAETNLNLEDNVNIQNQWRRFDAIIHKRRRAYIKKI